AFLPDPGGAGLRAFLLAGIMMLAAASVPRLALIDPALKAIEPLSGTSLLSPTTGDAKADRAAAIPATGTLLLRHPLGVGPADFRHGFLEVAWTSAGSPFSLSHQAVHAGNAFLEMAAETGVLGGLAFALLVLLVGLLALLATARAEPPWDAAGLAAFAAVGALIGAAFLGAPFQEPAPALLFWTAAGIVESAALRLRAAPAFARRLLPEERPISAVRRFAAGTVPGVLWLAAVLGLGLLVVDRARASRFTLIGQSAYFGGRYDVALLAFDQPPVRRSPDHLPRALAASSNLRLARYDEAVREFGETLERSPHYLAALLGRAAARKAQGLWDLADADYHAALQIWPDNGEIYLALAELDTARGRMDQALDDYRRVMQISPELADTYFKMGEIFLRRDQVDEAIEAYQVCGAKNPKYPRVRLRLGDAFYRKGLLEMALRYYQGAAADDDKSVDARMRIANTEHALGHPCESQESLEAARDLESDTERRATILDLLKKVEPDCKKKGKAAPDGGRPASRR
ncbi:MAG TPA: tetratricopeptide repeat protein, partial [Candidatus Polarisedimenticolia bacterium]|nr:tetratricopeptide repeat protein [Candidatus Polarisedimenticolia bacterium]